MKRILVTKVLPDGYAEAVEIIHTPDDYYRLDELPTFLIHPSLNPKEGGWIEQWREGEEILLSYGQGSRWVDINDPAIVEYSNDDLRRIVLLPLVEKVEDLCKCTTPKRHPIYPDLCVYCANKFPEGNTPANEQTAIKEVVLNCWNAITKEEFPVLGDEVLISKQIFIEQATRMVQGAMFMAKLYASQSPPSLLEAEKANELVNALEFTKGQVQDMDKWNQEAKKEIEKLKGLIEEAHYDGYLKGSWIGDYKYTASQGFTLFKTENQL